MSILKKTLWLITFILFLLGIKYACKLMADEDYPRVPGVIPCSFQGCKECEEAFVPMRTPGTTQYSKQMEFFDKFRYHRSRAGIEFWRASRFSYLFPSLDDKEKSEAFFQAAITMAAAGTPLTKVAAAISSLFLSYGLACMEEYHEMMSHYHQGMHHAELADFYLECALTLKG